MKTFKIALDPGTREELYADANTCFIDFLLLESIIITAKDLIGSPTLLQEATSDTHFYLNDPEIEMLASVENLLDVMKEFDRNDGVDVDAADYCLQDNHSWVADKLSLGISSISSANKALEVICINEELKDPIFTYGMSVRGTHLGNSVVMTVTPIGLPGI